MKPVRFFRKCRIRPEWMTVVALSLQLACVPEDAWAQTNTVGQKTTPRDKSNQSDGWRNGVVAADHPMASQVGAEILKQGGNVVDAAVATSFALSVVRPASCGIGGGGFMLIWNANSRKCIAIDYRERAPAAATEDMFSHTSNDELTEPASVRGGLAVGIPGTVAGLCYAAREYGSLPLHRLVAPAIRLAKNGVAIESHEKSVQQIVLNRFRLYSVYKQRFAELNRGYLNGGVLWQSNDRFYSPQLRTLEQIALKGADGFYQGEVADAIVESVQKAGGILTHADLRSDLVVERQPISGVFHSENIWAMPPPSSGGIALIQTLSVLQEWESLHDRTLRSLEHNSANYVHVVAEAMKHAFADRAEYLGDSDFVSVPVKQLLSEEYARATAAKIDLTQSRKATEYGRHWVNDDSGTSHFSIIDRQGNAVACTETINLSFGSFVVVPEFGIVLNNQMDDFAAQPGKANAFGLLQSEANAVAPGKKPLSSMSPTIVTRDGKAVFVSGASGGPRIISATLQATLNSLVFDFAPNQAVEKPRFHHQWFPNELFLEPRISSEIRKELERRGHQVKGASSLAANQSASRDDGRLSAESDPRKHGQPAGF